MFDDLKIRNKLVLLMAGPLVLILLLSALGARDRRDSASESREVESLVTTAQANANVVHTLQLEALYSSSYVGSDREGWTEEVTKSRKATDVALQKAIPRLSDVGGSTAVRSSADLAIGAADKLKYFRDIVDEGLRTDQLHELVINYAEMEATFTAVNINIADSLADPAAAAELRGLNALAAYKGALAAQGALIAGASGQENLGPQRALDAYANWRTDEANATSLLAKLSGASRKGAIRDALATEEGEIFEVVRRRAADSDDGAFRADQVGVTNSTASVLGSLHDVETVRYTDMISAARDASATAQRASTLFVLAAVVAIGATSVAALLLGRKITGPLNTLTAAADRLSGEQMPQLVETLKSPSDDDLGRSIGAMKPIELDSEDEIGQLARAFNEVQRVAGEVATEQALLLRKGIGEMFVNLARRNQALLDRQIEFIDELEREEEDPDQLDNLYRLDHLATRMRRNAESLLVLAGAEPPRRRGRPAPLANVVRAALAEVEDFGRIELLSFDEVLLASNAAADLAHLLSELMENATNFSPPETRVEVVGHKTKADGYVISVTDHGIGMAADQVAEANETLARPPLVGLAMSRSLGFIVVGRLGARHGISVRLMPSAVGGITAVVTIPPALVVDTPGAEAGHLPQSHLQPVTPPSASDDVAPLSFDAGSDAPALSLVPDPPTAPDVDPTAPVVFAPPAESTIAPTPEPVVESSPSPEPASSGPAMFAPPGGDESPPVSWLDDDALPTRSIFDLPPEELPGSQPVPSELAAEVDAAVSPAVPAALSFDAPDEPRESSNGHDPSANGGGNRPFFLEDAEPARPFGLPASDTPTPPPPPAAAEPATPRLFGTPAPAADPAPVEEEAPKLAVRRPAGAVSDGPPPPAPAPAPAPPAPAPRAKLPMPAGAQVSAPTPAVADEPAAAPVTTAESVVDEAPAAPAPPTVTTSSGLAKRVPRSAGANRPIPGSEAERGVAGSRRSPEEIRRMLAQHNAGRQRARSQEPVNAGVSDEREEP